MIVWLWPPTTALAVRICHLLLVMTFQIGFLVEAFRFRPLKIERSMPARAILAGVLLMLSAGLLGVLYDVLLRLVFGTEAPTIGPWGVARRLDFLLASGIVIWGVLIGPACDEWFFRAGLFGTWQSAGRPLSGALLSAALFALARLDPMNLPAYFGLGLLLCGVYRWTDSLLAVWIGHALLNVAMFVMLFCGYE
jgi:membrane protease YdiL (CAAX protease family)